MSDIVERLRRWTHAVDAVPASDLMDEAADEIERLGGLSPVTEPMPGFVSGSGSVTPVSYEKTDEKRGNSPTNRGTAKPRNGAVGKPVAWAVMDGEEAMEFCTDAEEAFGAARYYGGHTVPLYRRPQPTLTDAEREAVEQAIDAASGMGQDEPWTMRTLRGLLERMK